MTYTACGDPPQFPSVTTISITTTGIGTDWNTPIFYAPIQIMPSTLPYGVPTYGGYLDEFQSGQLYGPSPLEQLQKPLMDQQALQDMMQKLQQHLYQPSPFGPLTPNYEPPAQELAPTPKEEPEPAQDLTRPFQRKLDLD